MARDFDGTNDNLKTADNAVSGVNTDLKSYAYWIIRDSQPAAGQATIDLHTQASGTETVQITTRPPTVSGFLIRLRQVGATDGIWDTGDLPLNTLTHVAITYDRSSSLNDPVIYIDGTSVTITEVTATSTPTTGDDTLRLGETAAGAGDLNGTLGFVTIDGGALWAAADVNRHRWWGCAPGGPSTVEVWYPLWTTNLAQKGTGGGDLTASGTTVVSLPRVERCWGSMMGVGR